MTSLSPELVALLTQSTTASLTAALQKRGIRNAFFAELRPGKPGQKMIGIARTLRYVPMREDLVPVLSTSTNAQRRAIESINPGEVLVMEARGSTGAGTLGDIFAMRMLQRGAAGVVTDGCVRDSAAVGNVALPSYYRAAHAATWSREHLPLEIDIPVVCSGVLVMPGDVIVGDDDGAMVIPIALVEEVAAEAAEAELRDTWGFERVSAGESTIGTFPIAKDRMAEFEAWRAARADS